MRIRFLPVPAVVTCLALGSGCGGGAPPSASAPTTPSDPPFPGLRLGDHAQGLSVDSSDTVALGAEPFSLSNHKWMTEELECADNLNAAHYRQDLTMQTYSRAHFDNCAFDEALGYIDELVADARREAAKGNRKTAIYELGRAMHAIQDFYAHSNYVELMETVHPSNFADVPGVEAWTEPGHRRIAELRKGMLDGKPLPDGGALASEVFGLGFPKHCPAGTPDHGDRAKDSADMKNGKATGAPAWGYTRFQAARALARADTVKFLASTLGAWPELKGSCGQAAAFLTFQALHPTPASSP